jgi:hypothetical protein
MIITQSRKDISKLPWREGLLPSHVVQAARPERYPLAQAALLVALWAGAFYRHQTTWHRMIAHMAVLTERFRFGGGAAYNVLPPARAASFGGLTMSRLRM